MYFAQRKEINFLIDKKQQFLTDIAQQVEHLQSKFTDKDFLRNFTHITLPEYREFIKLVWENYEKAVM